MFTVYAIKSIKNQKRYVGYTGKDASDRLKEHNNGVSKFTRQNRPFVLIYKEIFGNKTKAIKREKFLKSGKGREFLDRQLNTGPLA